MKTANENSNAQSVQDQVAQIFGAAIAVNSKYCPDMVRHLAVSGHVATLRTILDSGLITRSFDYPAAMAVALAPLVSEPGYDQTRARLASDWLDALDLNTPEKLGKILTGVPRASDIVELMQAFPVDPLAVIPHHPNSPMHNCTALGWSLMRERSLMTLALLPTLLERGLDPVAYGHSDKTTSLFEVIVDSDLHHAKNRDMQNAAIHVLKEMAKLELPDSWKRQAGEALTHYVAQKGTINHEADRAVLQVMSVARFDDPQEWIRIMRSCDPPEAIASALLSEDSETLALAVIANMKHDGVDLNDLAAIQYNTAATMPWLHAAVAEDRAPVVEALLLAGCGPGVASHIVAELVGDDPRTVDRDASAMAVPGSDSERLLQVWKAKQSVDDLLKTVLAPRENP